MGVFRTKFVTENVEQCVKRERKRERLKSLPYARFFAHLEWSKSLPYASFCLSFIMIKISTLRDTFRRVSVKFAEIVEILTLREDSRRCYTLTTAESSKSLPYASVFVEHPACLKWPKSLPYSTFWASKIKKKKVVQILTLRWLRIAFLFDFDDQTLYLTRCFLLMWNGQNPYRTQPFLFNTREPCRNRRNPYLTLEFAKFIKLHNIRVVKILTLLEL